MFTQSQLHRDQGWQGSDRSGVITVIASCWLGMCDHGVYKNMLHGMN